MPSWLVFSKSGNKGQMDSTVIIFFDGIFLGPRFLLKSIQDKDGHQLLEVRP